MSLWIVAVKKTWSNMSNLSTSQLKRFMGPTLGPPGADRTQMGPMLAPWTLLLGLLYKYNPSWLVKLLFVIKSCYAAISSWFMHTHCTISCIICASLTGSRLMQMFHIKELILGLCPANLTQRYFVTTFLIGWAQSYNQPCIIHIDVNSRSVHEAV